METPLLATDGDDVTPSLSSGPVIVAEESEFSRLIAQCSSSSSNPLNDHFEVDQADHVAGFAMGSLSRGGGGRGGILMHGRDNDKQLQQQQQTSVPRGPWITSLAGTLSFVHVFLIWTSCYLPLTVWTSCHLHISLNWQHDFLPFLDDVTDTVIGTTNLASLLQDLYVSRQILLVLALCIVSLLLPCAFIIVSPTLVVADYKQPINLLQRSRSCCWTSARCAVEVSVRWAWMTGHVLLLLSLSTSFLELHWTDTRLRVGTRFNGPLAAYMLGITAAVGLVVLLRTPATEDDKTRLACYSYPGDTMMESSARSPQKSVSRHHGDASGNFQLLRTPPPHAFQHLSFPPLQLPQNNGFIGVVQDNNNDDDDDEPPMTVLEEELPSPTTTAPAAPAAEESTLENIAQAQQQPAHAQHPLPPSYSHRSSSSSPPTPDLVSEESFVVAGPQGMDTTFDTNAKVELTFWHKFTAFQLGLLSTVLWIPALYLPMLIVSYSGVAREFLQTSSLRFFVWQVPSTTWQQGRLFSETAATPGWILMVLVALLLVTMLVLPVLATCLGILTWLGEGKWSTCSQAWLYAIHPALGGIVFSVALFATVHALTPLGEFVLNQDTWEICNELEHLAGEACLVVHARLLPGAWFYLAQSIILESFVMATLRWC